MPRKQSPPRLPGGWVSHLIRRLARHAWKATSIARALELPVSTVRAILRSRPPAPRRKAKAKGNAKPRRTAYRGGAWFYRDQNVGRDAEIRELWAEGLRQVELAAMFGLNPATIRRILAPRIAEARAAAVEPAIAAELVAAEAAAELPATSAGEEWESDRPRGSRHPRSMLDFALAEEIRAEWARGGITQRELAMRWCISLATCKRALSGRSYAAPDPPAEDVPTPAAPPPRPRTPKPRVRATEQRDWDYRDDG